jgi:hypothetical protein
LGLCCSSTAWKCSVYDAGPMLLCHPTGLHASELHCFCAVSHHVTASVCCCCIGLCCCSCSKFLERAAELGTWSGRSRALHCIHVSFAGVSSSSSSSSGGGWGEEGCCCPSSTGKAGAARASDTGGKSPAINAGLSAAAAAAGEVPGQAPKLVLCSLRCSKLSQLLEGWLAAAEADEHITFLQHLLQVRLCV